MLTSLQDTICAVSTAPGSGGIAVLRLSGPDAFRIADEVCSQNVKEQGHMTLSFGQVAKDAAVLDEVVVGKFIGPRSYTGEDVIEISCHGSTYIQQHLMSLLIEKGARAATQGEFTKRAFLHGKLDLSQAEAVADLIASESASAHKLAMQQMKGGYSSEIKALREKLVEFAALLELELDFSEEDVEFADRSDFKLLITSILHKVRGLIDSFELGNVLKKGIPVAIIGAPNAGKSTLLNALLNEERAIVSDIAGTTRDAIEDSVNIEGMTFRFIDTAGVRETDDTIENQGIAIALKKAQQAAVVIKLIDAQQEMLQEEERLYRDYFSHVGWQDDERTLTVYNKVDLLETPPLLSADVIQISAMNGAGMDELKQRLLDKVDLKGSSGQDIIVSNARHVEALKKTEDALQTVLQGMEHGLSSDLLAIDVRKALHYLGELIGEVSTDDLLGTIFSRFCIGK